MRFGGVLFALALSISSAGFAADEDPICADRPGKANPSCTVPAGRVQVETGFIDWARDRSGGVRTDVFDLGATGVKLGLTDRLHIELDVTPYSRASVRGGGVHDHASGFGDSAVALKYRLTDGSAPAQLAFYPFVKIPTAKHGLGNGKVEGGAAMLADGAVPGTSLGWNLAPEVDVIADADGSGYHLGTTQALSLGAALSRRFSISGELWAAWDFDSSGTVRQASANAAAAYLLSPDVQVDAGVNLGLSRNTPDVELYSGIAFRF